MAILLDTSVQLAAAFARDVYHEAGTTFLRSSRTETRIVPAPVLSELFYMMKVRTNYARALAAFVNTRNVFQIVELTDEDMVRMEQIMLQYASAEFDYTDTAIMALAERLKITHIATFDRRDFSIYRPTHADYLELLP